MEAELKSQKEHATREAARSQQLLEEAEGSQKHRQDRLNSQIAELEAAVSSEKERCTREIAKRDQLVQEAEQAKQQLQAAALTLSVCPSLC